MDLSQDVVFTSNITKVEYRPIVDWKMLNTIVKAVDTQARTSGWTEKEGTYATTTLQFEAVPWHGNLLDPYPCFGLGVYRHLGFFLNKNTGQTDFYTLWDPYSSVGGLGPGLGGDSDPTDQDWAHAVYGIPNRIVGIPVGKSEYETIMNFITALTLNTPYDVGSYDATTDTAQAKAKLYGADGNIDPTQWEGSGYNVFTPPPRGGGYRITSAPANQNGSYPGTTYMLECLLDRESRIALRCGFPTLEGIAAQASETTTIDLASAQIILYTDPYQVILYDPGPYDQWSRGGQSFFCSAPFIPTEYQSQISYAAFCTDSLRNGDGTCGSPNTAVAVNSFFQSGGWTAYFGQFGVNLFGVQIGSSGTECDAGSGRPITNAVFVGLAHQFAGSIATAQVRIAGLLWNMFMCMRYEPIGGSVVFPIGGTSSQGYLCDIFLSTTGALQKSIYLISSVQDL